MIRNFQNIDRLFAAVTSALPPVPRRTTGQAGAFRTLREGWAEVGIWPAHGADEHAPVQVEYWSGPILHDSDTHITLDIGAEPMTWMKGDRITVKYGDQLVGGDDRG